MSEIKQVITSQYLAALAMLRQAVENCPDDLWDADQPNRFWRTAEHALFYAHFYLHAREEDFQPWAKHRPELRSLKHSEAAQPFNRDDILAYIAFCEAQVPPMVDALDLHAGSGFHWLPFNKLELQFYNIRHIQHHAGELYQQLLGQDFELRWVGMVKPE